jgi:CRP/FNR family transcriptional regulator, cyclic AMP receptor protein
MDEAKLRDIPLFAKLSRKQRKLLALRADEVDVRPGKLVCRKGESANEVYVIEAGTARVVRDDQYLDELGPGDLFGEMGVLDDAPRNAHVVAKTPMTLMILSGAALRELQREEPELARRISSTIEQRRHWLEPAL